MFMLATAIAQVNWPLSLWNIPYFGKYFVYPIFTHLYLHGMCRINNDIFVSIITLWNKGKMILCPDWQFFITYISLFFYPIWEFFEAYHIHQPSWNIFQNVIVTLTQLICLNRYILVPTMGKKNPQVNVQNSCLLCVSIL